MSKEKPLDAGGKLDELLKAALQPTRKQAIKTKAKARLKKQPKAKK